MIKAIFKGLVYFLGLCTLIGLLSAACADEDVDQAKLVETDQGTVMVIPEEPDSEVEFVPAEPEEEMQKFTLVDNELVQVNIVNIYEDPMWNEVGFEMEIINKTDIMLMVSIDDVSVNGVMNDPFWATEVAPGKTAYSNMGWYINGDTNKNVKSLEDLKNIEGTLKAYDSNDIIDGVRTEDYVQLIGE